MNKDELLEEYRKIKLEEELDKAMWKKYKPIKVEITYHTCKTYSIILPVDPYRFEEFIKRELNELVKNEGKN
jgi:hypothetical protein